MYESIQRNYSKLLIFKYIYESIFWVIVLYNCSLFHQWTKGGIYYLKHQTQQPENLLDNLFTLVWIWEVLFMSFAQRNSLTGEELEHLPAMAACTVFSYFCAGPTFFCVFQSKSLFP